MIWSRNFTVDELNSDRLNRNMSKHLDIQIEEITDSELKGSMPVDHRTMQPFDLLHGGASVVLAETLGSIASNLIVAESGKNAVGLHIEANHLSVIQIINQTFNYWSFLSCSICANISQPVPLNYYYALPVLFFCLSKIIAQD